MKKFLAVFLVLSLLFTGISAAEEKQMEWYTVETDQFANFAGTSAAKFILTSESNLSGVALIIGACLEKALPELYEVDLSLKDDIAAFAAYDLSNSENALHFFVYNKIDRMYWWTYLDFDDGVLGVAPYNTVYGETLVNMMTDNDNSVQMRYVSGTAVHEAYNSMQDGGPVKIGNDGASSGEIIFPQGKYIVGTDIPAGSYFVKSNDEMPNGMGSVENIETEEVIEVVYFVYGLGNETVIHLHDGELLTLISVAENSDKSTFTLTPLPRTTK